MTKIVLDSDGLIKLTKAGCLKEIIDHFECLITEEVYDETVVKGLERYYDDAFEVNEFIKDGILKVEKKCNNQSAHDMLGNHKFGKGESSSLHLFLNIDAKAIISDDRAFINLLDKNDISYVIPTDLIVRLYELNVITKEKSIKALDRIKIYVQKYSYDVARRNLEG